MEIVSEPDIRSAEEAQEYVRKLRSILRYIGTCDGNMEEGSLRCDVNISVRRKGEDFGTRCEIKNVNSIKSIGQAIDYEFRRQFDVINSGNEIIQETRLFDEKKGETRPMRSKEEAHDYTRQAALTESALTGTGLTSRRLLLASTFLLSKISGLYAQAVSRHNTARLSVLVLEREPSQATATQGRRRLNAKIVNLIFSDSKEC